MGQMYSLSGLSDSISLVTLRFSLFCSVSLTGGLGVEVETGGGRVGCEIVVEYPGPGCEVGCIGGKGIPFISFPIASGTAMR